MKNDFTNDENLEVKIQTILGLLDNQEYAEQIEAIESLEMMGEKASVAIPKLLALIKDVDNEKEDLRIQSIKALTKMGSKTIEAIPTLINVLYDFDRNEDSLEIKREIEKALVVIGEIYPREIVSQILDPQKIDEWWFNNSACEIIPKISELKPEAVINQLIEAIPKSDGAFVVAIKSLNQIIDIALPSLLQALGNNNPKIRYYIVSAFQDIKSNYDEIIPNLEKIALNDESEDVRDIATKTIIKIKNKKNL